MCDIALKAVWGRDGIFPFTQPKKFGKVQVGAEPSPKGSKFLNLDQTLLLLEQTILLPPLFTPNRYKKMLELMREPLFIDVKTESELGGFKTKIPLAIAAMGSTDIANKPGLALAEGAAKSGIIHVIGENVINMRGYDKRSTNQPCLKERMLAFLSNCEDCGGLVIQANVEDANSWLFGQIYSDKDLDPYIDDGLIGFEIKCGQGAKPGLGGEVKVDRQMALRLVDKYFFPDDPRTIDKEMYDRHSVPGTFNPAILHGQIKNIRNQYPKVKVWVKTAGYRDLEQQVRIAANAGADAITIDGAEGGSGMSPTVALNCLGYPTVVCMKKIADAKKEKTKIDMIIAGGLTDGSHIVKSLCLGIDGVAMGRAFIIASEARLGPLTKPLKRLENPVDGIVNFVDATKVEVQMLASALDAYNLNQLNKEGIAALNKTIADMFKIEYIFS